MSAGNLRTVTLYTRPGCHLCVQAEALLRELAGPLGIAVELVDIEEDDDLLRRFMLEIPVVAGGGEVIARAPIGRPALREALGALPG